MRTLRHPVAGFIFLMVFMGLFVTIYSGFQEQYDITPGNLDEGKTIAQSLRDLTLINDIREMLASIHSIVAPRNPFDVVGGLLAAGFGTLKIISGIITLPFKIIAILVGFYPGVIPPIIERAIDVLVTAYVGFLILSAILKSDV